MKLAGWKHTGGAVWDHTSGIRIHVQCLLLRPDGSVVRGTCCTESRNLDRAVRVCGGNRKRGVMLWAMETERT